MAGKSRSEIIGDIESYVGRNGGVWGEWFVGVTGAPKQKLFAQHKVRQTGDAWISRLAKDEHEAHEVAEYLVTIRKAKGKFGAPRDTDLYIYCFKIKSHTRV
ncbi:MAG TPA: hypothetical protein VLL76_00625 [Candidatus Omnitrophota bacterium]|nr:hypothetical protein [Candidatus Omnitrophota bacterium]